MERAMRNVYFLLSVLFCASLFAESPATSPVPPAGSPPVTYDIVPTFNDLMNSEGNSSLSMLCTKFDKESVFCNAVRLYVVQLSTEEMKSRLVGAKQHTEHMTPEQLNGGKQHFCPIYETDEKLLAGAQKIRNRDFYVARSAIEQKLCKAKSPSVFGKTLQELIRFDAETCTVNSEIFQMGLTKESDTTWKNISSPQGPCKLITTIIVDKVPKTDYNWTYRETQTPAVKDDPKCAQYQNTKPIVYSWDEPHLLTNRCKYLSLGTD